MTRHVLDHPTHQTHGGEMQRYAEMERQNGTKGPHPATTSLQQRGQNRAVENSRMRAFLKIDRDNH